VAVHVGVVFGQEAEGNLTNDGRWSYVWDAENRLIQMTVNTNVGPQYQLTFAYDPQGRRIEKIVLIGGVPQSTNLFLYDGWNLIGELAPNDLLIRSYVWGNDLSGSQQGAGGVGGLVEMSYAGTNCFVAYDGNGNVAALVNAADGTVVANYEYGPFGEVIRATGPMAKQNPFRFATQYYDDESDIVWYPRRPYSPPTGRWLSRDPIEEEGGENLYIFCGNDSLNHWDLLGEKWKVDRNGGAKASAVPEKGDTVADLASMIGLNAPEYQRWLTADSGTAMPGSSGQAMGGCEHFEVPNTVVAYWAGNLGWFGRWYVRWNSSVKYLGSLGFKVENHHHQKGDTWGLTKMLIPTSVGKELHGAYFWGHGGHFGPPGSSPYPAEDLFSDSDDPVLAFSSPGLYYHMGLGLVFACDSNSGQSALMSGNGIWKGFTGTLVPWPYPRYHAKHYIHHGDQATH
jgi:RHS repeat-associated protein